MRLKIAAANYKLMFQSIMSYKKKILLSVVWSEVGWLRTQIAWSHNIFSNTYPRKRAFSLLFTWLLWIHNVQPGSQRSQKDKPKQPGFPPDIHQQNLCQKLPTLFTNTSKVKGQKLSKTNPCVLNLGVFDDFLWTRSPIVRLSAETEWPPFPAPERFCCKCPWSYARPLA